MQPMIPGSSQRGRQGPMPTMWNNYGRGSMGLQVQYPLIQQQQQQYSSTLTHNLGHPSVVHPNQIREPSHGQATSSFPNTPHESYYDNDWINPTARYQPQQATPGLSETGPYVTSSPSSYTNHTSSQNLASATPRTTHMQPYTAGQQTQFEYTPQYHGSRDWQTAALSPLQEHVSFIATNSNAIPGHSDRHGTLYGAKSPENARSGHVPSQTALQPQHAQGSLQRYQPWQQQQQQQQGQSTHLGFPINTDGKRFKKSPMRTLPTRSSPISNNISNKSSSATSSSRASSRTGLFLGQEHRYLQHHTPPLVPTSNTDHVSKDSPLRYGPSRPRLEQQWRGQQHQNRPVDATNNHGFEYPTQVPSQNPPQTVGKLPEVSMRRPAINCKSMRQPAEGSPGPHAQIKDHQVGIAAPSVAPPLAQLEPQSRGVQSQAAKRPVIARISTYNTDLAPKAAENPIFLEGISVEEVHPGWGSLDRIMANLKRSQDSSREKRVPQAIDKMVDGGNVPNTPTAPVENIKIKEARTSSSPTNESSGSESESGCESSTAVKPVSQRRLAKRRRKYLNSASLSMSKSIGIRKKAKIQENHGREKFKKRKRAIKKRLAENGGRTLELGNEIEVDNVVPNSPKKTSPLRHVMLATPPPEAPSDTEKATPSTLVNLRGTLSVRNVAATTHTLTTTANSHLRTEKSMSPLPAAAESSSRGQKRKASAIGGRNEDDVETTEPEIQNESEHVPAKLKRRRMGPLSTGSKRAKNSKISKESVTHQVARDVEEDVSGEEVVVTEHLREKNCLQDTADDTILETIYVLPESTSTSTSTSSSYSSSSTLRSSKRAIAAYKFVRKCAKIACQNHKRQDDLKPQWWPMYYFMDEYLEEKLEKNKEFPDDVNTWKMLWIAGQLNSKFQGLVPENVFTRVRPYCVNAATCHMMACLQGIPLERKVCMTC